MKRLFSLFAVLLLLVSAIAPAYAYNDPSKPKLVVSSDDNKNQSAGVISRPEDMLECSTFGYMHLKEPEMLEIIKKFPEVIPEGARIEHVTMIRQRDVTGTFPAEMTFCIWNGTTQYMLLFFREYLGGEEYDPHFSEWQLIACDLGEFLDAEIPTRGQYALAKTWGTSE